jgi:hypothetical protein
VKEKEREWNLLIHKKKRMEEYYLRLRRKKEVTNIETTGILPPVTASTGTGSSTTSTSNAHSNVQMGSAASSDPRSKTSSPHVSIAPMPMSSPTVSSHTVHHGAPSSSSVTASIIQQQAGGLQQKMGPLGAQINVHQLISQQAQQQAHLQLLQAQAQVSLEA